MLFFLLLLLFYFCITFIPSRNLDEVFTYNNMALIPLRNRFHINASMVLTRDDHLFIHTYIRSLLNNILRPILMAGRDLNPHPTTCVSDALPTEPHMQFNYVYIYIYIYIYIQKSACTTCINKS